MRGKSRYPPPSLFVSAVVAGAVSFAGCSGCSGRPEFRSGEERRLRGDLPGAYRDFHEAYYKSGKTRHRSARDDVGGRIGLQIGARAAAREQAGDIDGALDECLLALEYDPGSQALAGDYLRVRERLERVEALRERARSAGGAWESFRLWRELLGEAVHVPEVFEQIGEAAMDAADREIEILSDELPARREAIEARRAAWLDLADRLADLITATDSLSLATLGPALLPRRERAFEEARILEVAEAAERELSEAARREKAGDLTLAVRGYRQALHLWSDWPEVRDGLPRAEKELIREASDFADAGMARGDWAAALDRLELIERMLPGVEEVSRKAARCRRQIRDGLLRDAGGLRERGLPASALCALLRLRSLGLGTEESEREIELLEAAVRRRWQIDVGIDFQAAGAEDEDLDVALWGEEVRDAVEDAVRAAVSPPTPASGSPARHIPTVPGFSGNPVVVEVQDVDFEYRLDRVPAGSRESQFVAEFLEGPNPERFRAAEELEAALKEQAEARESVAAAPAERRAEAAARLAIAGGRVRRAQADVDRTPPTVPLPVWQRERYPVLRVEVEAVLALRVRLQGEFRWISVRQGGEDWEVAGDSQRGIPPDPAEVPSRKDLLAALAPRIGRTLALLLEDHAAARRLHLLHEARERFAAESFEAGLESLVAFLYSERELGPGPLYPEGLELFRRMTGGPFPLEVGVSPTERAAPASAAPTPSSLSAPESPNGTRVREF